MRVLGIETSCDETAAAVVVEGAQILANVVSSQIDLHRPYGGVVPELASRQHLELIDAVIQSALDQAGMPFTAVDAVAATYGPGLASSLLIGLNVGKGLAAALQKLYPGKVDFPAGKRLIGSDEVIRQLQSGEDPRTIQQGFQDAVAAFAERRARYLLY